MLLCRMVRTLIRLAKPLDKASMSAAHSTFRISNHRFQISYKTRISTLATSTVVKDNLNKISGKALQANTIEEVVSSNHHQEDSTVTT